MRHKGKQMAGCLLLMAAMLAGMTACGNKASDTENTVQESTQAEIVKEESSSAEESTEEVKETETVEVTVAEAAVVLHITINPELNLFADKGGTVLAVEYVNDDAKDAFSDIELTGMDVTDAVKQVVSTSVEKGYLKDGKQITVEMEKGEAAEAEVLPAELSEQITASVQEALAEEEITVQLALSVEGEKQPAVEIKPENAATNESSDSRTEEPAQVTESQAAEPKASEAQPEEPKASNPCKACGGTGKCDECKGDGYRGSGYTVSCPRCHGSLTETCIYCDASGNSKKHEGTCDFPNCMGAHVYACTICNGGSTPVVCESCGGSGNCSSCGGTGVK